MNVLASTENTATPATHSLRVSVVVPTHGRPELLERLLRSLVSQDYPADAYEIIVVHNLSADDTEARVQRIREESPVPIRYFTKNYKGPALSRDFGVSVAEGSIVAFIDDDCVATPGWLSAGAAAMKPGIGLVQGRTLPCPDQPRRLVERTIEIPEATPFFETCNIFYRRDAMSAVGGFSKEFAEQIVFGGEDTDLAWKVKESGFQVAFAADALVHHEVFQATLLQWLLEPRRMYVWPHLVKKHPGLREHLYLRYFLTKRSALFDMAIVGALLALFLHPIALVLVLPYVVYRLGEPSRRRNPLVRVVRLIAGVPRAFIVFVMLIMGSMRYRAVLL